MAKKPKHIKLRKYIRPDASVTEISTKGDEVRFCGESSKASDVLVLMLKKGLRRIPVIDEKTDHFSGIVSTTDMINFLGAGEKHAIFQKNNTGLDTPIKDIMETQVLKVDKNHDISRLINLMKMHDVGGLPVIYQKKLVGFVSESDIIRRVKGRIGLRVDEVMRKKPFFVREEYSMFDVARMMVRGPYRRLPVVKDGIVTGIVTPYDVLKYLNTNKRLRGFTMQRFPIRRAMNTNVIYVKPQQKLHDAIRIMNGHNIGGMPVVRGEEMDIVGIITEKDIIDFLI